MDDMMFRGRFFISHVDQSNESESIKQSTAELHERIRELESLLEQEKASHSEARSQAQQRELSLQGEVAEYTTTIATLQRKVEQAETNKTLAEKMARRREEQHQYGLKARKSVVALMTRLGAFSVSLRSTKGEQQGS